MAKINLLPWREALRAEKKKEFITLVCVVLVVAVISAFGWDRLVSSQIEAQDGRNAILKAEIAKLEKQVTEIKELKKRRQDLLDRMQVIQELQGNRPEIVRIYDEFVRAVPDGVYFTKMTRKDKQVSLEGYAESNNRVSALMRQLDASYKFTEPNLTKVQANDTLGEDGSRFEMRVKIINTPVEPEVQPENAEGDAQ